MLYVWLNSNEVQLPVGKVWFCSHPGRVTSAWRLQETPAQRATCAGLKERCESQWGKWWIYEPACLLGCGIPPCTQVSCKLPWWFHLLVFHVQYCWMCCCSAGESDCVQRLDRGRGRYKEGKPPFLLSGKSHHFLNLSIVWRVRLWIKTSRLRKFSLNQTSSSRCCDFVSGARRHSPIQCFYGETEPHPLICQQLGVQTSTDRLHSFHCETLSSLCFVVLLSCAAVISLRC